MPLTDDTIAQTVLFLDLVSKPLIATFDQPHVNSDGGSMLLKAADRGVGALIQRGGRAVAGMLPIATAGGS